MLQEWLKITKDIANRISPDWLFNTELPLPDDSYIKQAAEWRRMSSAERTAEIERIRTAQVSNKPVLLFVLWTWEPSAKLRKEIIRGFPKEDRVTAPRVLAKIFRHETPDSNGKAVRNEVIRFLSDQKRGERPTLGGAPRHCLGEHEKDSLDSALAELDALRGTNRWL